MKSSSHTGQVEEAGNRTRMACTWSKWHHGRPQRPAPPPQHAPSPPIAPLPCPQFLLSQRVPSVIISCRKQECKQQRETETTAAVVAGIRLMYESQLNTHTHTHAHERERKEHCRARTQECTHGGRGRCLSMVVPAEPHRNNGESGGNDMRKSRESRERKRGRRLCQRSHHRRHHHHPPRHTHHSTPPIQSSVLYPASHHPPPHSNKATTKRIEARKDGRVGGEGGEGRRPAEEERTKERLQISE